MGWVDNATPRPLYPRERAGTHCIGGWVGPRAGLDRCGNLAATGNRSLDRPARSQSLYRLSYPGPRYLSLTRTNESVTDTGGTNTTQKLKRRIT